MTSYPVDGDVIGRDSYICEEMEREADKRLGTEQSWRTVLDAECAERSLGRPQPGLPSRTLEKGWPSSNRRSCS